jgi:hypothetical protein
LGETYGIYKYTVLAECRVLFNVEAGGPYIYHIALKDENVSVSSNMNWHIVSGSAVLV